VLNEVNVSSGVSHYCCCGNDLRIEFLVFPLAASSSCGSDYC